MPDPFYDNPLSSFLYFLGLNIGPMLDPVPWLIGLAVGFLIKNRWAALGGGALAALGYALFLEWSVQQYMAKIGIMDFRFSFQQCLARMTSQMFILLLVRGIGRLMERRRKK